MMGNPAEPLKFPNHYPPTDKWKKFFIGVRWLGPDLSFFKDLETLQASRSIEQMNVWGKGVRKRTAETMSEILHRHLLWKTSVFIPEDRLNVVWHSPKFGWLDSVDQEETLGEIEEKFGFRIPATFWNGLEDASFGEFIDKFIALGHIA